jgi:peptidoglycan-associated lipoprotein
MRTAFLVPLVALFGCAHESMESKEAATASVSTPAEATPAPTKEEMASAEKPKGMTCPTVRVHFPFDSAEVEDSQKPQLDDAARCLKDNQRMRVSIAGNADESGAEDYNRALGQRRAEAVANYLESMGASPQQVQAVVSFGEDNPLCEEDTPQCRARNRRTAVRATCHL